MRKLLFIAITLLATLPAFSQYDEFAGFYKGKITLANGAELKRGYPVSMYPEIYAEVYRGPEAKYRLKLLTGILARAEASFVAENLTANEGKIVFSSKTKAFDLNGTITPKEVVATGVYQGQKVKIALKRFVFKSPTLGAKAPEGAVVLFDGTKKCLEANWVLVGDKTKPANWILGDGAMTVETNMKRPNGKRFNTTIESKKAFGKCKLHIEFRTAPLYDKMAQARSNSGVFFGPYEVQVLDSFGADATWDHCGSIYRQTASQYNASLEPGAWQTYDIEYTPAKYEGDKVVEYPTFTVYHNGKCVQRATPVPYGTSIALKDLAKFVHPKEPVNLRLQDHTDAVSFRNIWVQEL